MRAGTLTRFFLAATVVATVAGGFARTAAADHRADRSHQENIYPRENTYPRSSYSRGDHWSRGWRGGGYGGQRNHGYAGSILAVPIIIAPPAAYPSQYPSYIQQPYPAYRYVQPPAPIYYGR
jgi:hypothetical protein